MWQTLVSPQLRQWSNVASALVCMHSKSHYRGLFYIDKYLYCLMITNLAFASVSSFHIEMGL